MGWRKSGWEPQDFIFAFEDLGVLFMSDGRMELDRRLTSGLWQLLHLCRQCAGVARLAVVSIAI